MSGFLLDTSFLSALGNPARPTYGAALRWYQSQDERDLFTCAVVIGENLPRAVGRSIYLELSARLQMQAIALAGPGGRITYLDESEVKASDPVQNYARAWPMWRAKALEGL